MWCLLMTWWHKKPGQNISMSGIDLVLVENSGVLHPPESSKLYFLQKRNLPCRWKKIKPLFYSWNHACGICCAPWHLPWWWGQQAGRQAGRQAAPVQAVPINPHTGQPTTLHRKWQLSLPCPYCTSIHAIWWLSTTLWYLHCISNGDTTDLL